jgi:hypothetical protein
MTEQEALQYVGRALVWKFPQWRPTDTFDLSVLPEVLEKYDTEVEPLSEEDANFVCLTFIAHLEGQR